MADQNVDLVITDLGTDATRWDRASEAFSNAVAGMDQLYIGNFVMDGLSFAQGATGAYNHTLDELLTRLRAGVTETARIAQALRDTATNMRNSEEEAGG
jgi:hypothetical protein